MGLSDGRGEIDPDFTVLAEELADKIHPDILYPSNRIVSHALERRGLIDHCAPVLHYLVNEGLIDFDELAMSLQTSPEDQSAIIAESSQPFEHHVSPLGVVTEGRRITPSPAEDKDMKPAMVETIFGPVDAEVYEKGREILKADLDAIANAEIAAYRDSDRIINE